jgi:pimeloyl-ACP methyl ester carboxylesterase
MVTFVLVHPAWLGGWSWKKLVPLLHAAGHAVYTPTLTGLGQRAHLAHAEVDLHTHVADVVNVLTFEDLDRVVLVGNSSGGMVITGVAEQVPERLAGLTYLDAFVPGDGQCLLDLVPPDRRTEIEVLVRDEGDGWRLPRFAPPPWAEIVPRMWQVTDRADVTWMLPRLRPTPFGHFTTPLQLRSPAARDLPRTYIRCSRMPHSGFDRFARQATETPGWRHRQLDCGHIPYVSHPEPLAAVLLDLVAGDPVPARSAAKPGPS